MAATLLTPGRTRRLIPAVRVLPLRSAAALFVAASFAVPPGSLRAQGPAPLPVMTPPPLPAGMPPGAPGGRPSMAGDSVRLAFANTDVRDVLDNYYAPLIGKRVIYDNTLQGQLTIFINTPVARDEAVRILENNLMLNGFHIVQGENNIVRVLSGPKNPRFYGPPIYSDASQLPEGDQVVSFLIKPRYIDIAELNQVLGQYIQLQKPYTSFIALPKTGAILATEDSPTLRRLLPVIEALDVPPATVIDKFVKLERADAAKAVEFVNAVLGKEKTGSGNANAGITAVTNNSPGGTQRRPIRRLNEEGQPLPDGLPLGLQPSPGLQSAVAALSEGNLTAGSVNIQADIRTNRVHIVARPSDFPFLERLVAEFDANTPFANPVRRSLRFVTATDMLPILVQSLTEQGAPDSGGQNGANTSGNSNRNGNGSNRGGNFGSNASSGGSNGSLGANSGSSSLFGSNSSGSGGDSSGTSTGGLGTSNLQTSEVSDVPQAAIVGTTRLIADPRTNSISILGGAEAREKVDRLLTLLDVPTPQVMIEVLIGELSLSNSEQFGINYLLRSGKNAQLTTNNTSLILPGTTTTGGLTGGTTTTDPVTGVVTQNPGTATTTTTAVNLASIAAQSVAGFGGVAGTLAISKYFATAITALENSGRFKTISRPIIFTSNNKAATILSGQEIAIASGQSSGIGGTTTSTQYRRVALQLDVVPLINSANAVTLDIVQQVNSLVPNSNTIINGNSTPTIATRAVKSTVTVPNMGTVVLGGLITQSENVSRGGVPVLNRIPLLGELFKSRTRDAPRNELIILLRPVITNTAAQLIASRRDEENHLYLEPGLDRQLRPIPKAIPVEKVEERTTVRRERTTTTTVVPLVK